MACSWGGFGLSLERHAQRQQRCDWGGMSFTDAVQIVGSAHCLVCWLGWLAGSGCDGRTARTDNTDARAHESNCVCRWQTNTYTMHSRTHANVIQQMAIRSQEKKGSPHGRTECSGLFWVAGGDRSRAQAKRVCDARLCLVAHERVSGCVCVQFLFAQVNADCASVFLLSVARKTS